MLACKAQKNGVRAEIIHFFPGHSGKIYAGVGAIKIVNCLIALTVKNLYLAGSCHVYQYEFRAKIGVLASYDGIIASVHVKNTLYFKGNVLHSLNYYQFASFIAAAGKFQHFDGFNNAHIILPDYFL